MHSNNWSFQFLQLNCEICTWSVSTARTASRKVSNFTDIREYFFWSVLANFSNNGNSLQEMSFVFSCLISFFSVTPNQITASMTVHIKYMNTRTKVKLHQKKKYCQMCSSIWVYQFNVLFMLVHIGITLWINLKWVVHLLVQLFSI